MHHNVKRPRQVSQPPSHRSPQSAPDAVTLYRASQHLAHGESHTRAGLVIALAIKGREVTGKMFSAVLVNRLKVRVPQKS